MRHEVAQQANEHGENLQCAVPNSVYGVPQGTEVLPPCQCSAKPEPLESQWTCPASIKNECTANHVHSNKSKLTHVLMRSMQATLCVNGLYICTAVGLDVTHLKLVQEWCVGL